MSSSAFALIAAPIFDKSSLSWDSAALFNPISKATLDLQGQGLTLRKVLLSDGKEILERSR